MKGILLIIMPNPNVVPFCTHFGNISGYICEVQSEIHNTSFCLSLMYMYIYRYTVTYNFSFINWYILF